jgi:5-methylcytosine-specific restriction endonuclease McrA
MKRCGVCRREKTEAEFSGAGNGRLQGKCKSCCNEYAKTRAAKFRARSSVEYPVTKRCYQCDSLKNSSEFGRNISNKDGLASECRACKKINDAAYNAANIERIRERSRQYYRDHKVRHRELSKAYSQANREKMLAYYKAYYVANKEKYLAAQQVRYALKSEEIKANRRAYCKANPERVRAVDQRMRARRIAAAGTHTAEDIQELMRLQRGKCAVCRSGIQGKYHVDHVYPLSKDGTNDRYNIQLLCGTCNHKKHAKDPIQFMQERGFLL